MATVGTFNVVLAVSTGKFVGGLSQAERKWDRFARNVQRQAKALPAAMQKSASASLALARNVIKFGAVGVVALTGLGIAGVKLAADFEQTRLAFETLLGSAEEGNRVLKELAEFTARTPFQFRDVTEATRQLLVFGFAAEEVQGMLTNLGDTVAAMGGTGSDLAALAAVFGKIRAQGRVTARKMMQLSQRGIPAWEMLAEAIGTDIPGAMEQVSKGAVNAALAVTAITEGMAKRFGGMMEVQSKTLLGRLSTLKDNLEIILRGMGEDIIRFTRLGERVDRLTKTFSNLAAVVMEKGFINALREAFPPWLTPVIIAITGAIVGGLVPAIVLATMAMTKKLMVATGLSIVLLWKWMLVGAAVAAVAYILARSWGRLGDVAKAVWMGISAVVMYAASLVVSGVGAILTALSWVVPGLSGAAKAVHGFAASLRQSAASAWTAARSGLTTTEAVAKSTETAAKTGEAAAKAQDEFGKAVEGAGKKAQKNLQAFDEVHTLQEDMGAGAPEYDIPMLDMPDMAPAIGPVGAAVAEMGEQMSRMADTAASAWERLKQAMEPVNRAVQWIKDNWPTIGPIIEGIASVILIYFIPALVKTGIEAVKNAGKVVLAWTMQSAEAVKSAAIQVGQFVVLVGKWIWMGVQATFNAAKVALAWGLQGWEAVKSVAMQVGQFVIAGAKWLWLGVQAGIGAAQVVAAWIVQRVQAVVSVATQIAQFVILGAKWVWMGITAMANAAVMAAAWFVALGPVAWVIAIIALVAAVVALNWEFVKTKTIEIWTAVSAWIAEKWEAIKTWATEKFGGTLKAIAEKWEAVRTKTSEIWEALGNWIAEKWDAIKTWASERWQGVKTNIETPIVAVANWLERRWNEVSGTLGRIWDGIGNTAKQKWDGVKDIIRGTVNSIIDLINRFIRWWNRIEIKVPSITIPFVGTFGGWSIRVPQIPEIPMLAKGGLVTGPTLAVLGERGPEVVKPLPRAEQEAEVVARAVYAAIIDAFRFVQPGQEEKEIVLQIDGSRVARVILPALVREGQRTGMPVMPGVVR